MSLRFLLFVGIATTVSLMVSEAGAMSKSTAQANIADKAAANPWVGSPSPTIVNPALTICPSAGPCTGWHEVFSNWTDIYTWDDGATSQTHIVGGMILNGYNWFSAANGFLKYPTTEELDTMNLTGKKQKFQGGTIYYKWGAGGSYEVNGWIERKWNALGTTESMLGFPVTNEANYGSGKRNIFEYGEVIWDGIIGTWKANAWPVLTVASRNPTKTNTWVTGRAVSISEPSYEIFGCGFTPNSTVALRVNNRSQR